MRDLSFVTVFVLISISITAQNRYIPGKIQFINNEKKEVNIFFEDWIQSPQRIKVSEDGQTKEYYADQISGFEIPSLQQKYIAERLKLNFIAKTPIASYSQLFLETITEHFFLRNIISSDVLSLYSLIDSEERTRFYLRKGNELIELVNYSFLYLEKGVLVKKTNSEYKTQLKNMFADEPRVLSSMPAYLEESFIKFTKKYIQSKGIVFSEFQSHTEGKSGFKFGFNLGVEGLQNMKYGFPKNNFNFGLSAMYQLPHKHNNRFFAFGVYFAPSYNYLETMDSRARKTTFTTHYGRFFGNKNLQVFTSVGISFSNQVNIYNLVFSQKKKFPESNIGPNFGIAYKKKFILELSKSFLFLGGSGITKDPQIHFKYLPWQSR
jgi:hypothetical protein